MQKKRSSHFLIIFIFMFLVMFLHQVVAIHYLFELSEKIESGRAHSFLQDIRATANIEEEIDLYETPLWLNRIDHIRRHNGRVSIMLRTKSVEKLSDIALKALIAHEVGHLVNDHLKTVTQMQVEADDFAVSIVGEEAVDQFLKEFGISRGGRGGIKKWEFMFLKYISE